MDLWNFLSFYHHWSMNQKYQIGKFRYGQGLFVNKIWTGCNNFPQQTLSRFKSLFTRQRALWSPFWIYNLKMRTFLQFVDVQNVAKRSVQNKDTRFLPSWSWNWNLWKIEDKHTALKASYPQTAHQSGVFADPSLSFYSELFALKKTCFIDISIRRHPF